MAHPTQRAVFFLSALLVLSGSLWAQEWKLATTLPGVDFKDLTPAQKTKVLNILRTQGCSCGCGMRMAQCRMEDPNCSYSNGLAATIIQAIKDGKTEDQAIQAAMTSRFGANHPNQILEEPVAVPVAGSPVTGPANATVTLVEFSDFQCPYCIQAVPEIDALLKVYPKQVKLIFKQFPLEIHSDAYRAATAAIAAQKQGKFWEMHYAMFEHHQDLSENAIFAIAKGLNLDIDRLHRDMDSKETKEIVAKDLEDGNTAGVQGTPTIFINGQRYNGRIQLAPLRDLIDAELKKTTKPQQTATAKSPRA